MICYQIAEERGLDMMMVSAKTGENVDKAFNDLTTKLLQNIPKVPLIRVFS